MKIAIDLDDVTVAIMDGITTFHNKKYNTHFSVHDHIDWDLYKIWNCTPEESMNRVYEFYNSPFMDTVLPMEGAIEGIGKLHIKHSLVFITSRPVSVEEKTKKWLKKYFPSFHLPVYFTNQFTPAGHVKQKKSDICKKLDIPIIIEDSPMNVTDCITNNIRVLLFTRPWNTLIKNTRLITRVHNWEDITDEINKIT